MEPRRPAWPGPLWPLIGRQPPSAMGRGSLRPRETVQTRAVNQQVGTMTPREAKTLLSVNTHRNSRLLNLQRNRVKSERSTLGWKSWAKLKSYITIYALIQSFMTPISPPQCEKCCFQKTRLSTRNSHAILMLFSILETQGSPSNSCDRWSITIYVEKWEQSIFQLILHPTVEAGRVCDAGWSFKGSRTQ